jgi:uncharacterized membrane protein YhdT
MTDKLEYTNYNFMTSLKKSSKDGASSISQLFNTLVVQNAIRGFYAVTGKSQVEAIRFSLLFFIVLFSSIILYYSGNSKTFLQNRVYTYAACILLPILFFFYVSTKINAYTGSAILLGIFATGIAIALMLYAYSQMTATAALFFNFIVTIIVFFIVIIGLALTYNVFMNYINKQEGVTGFLLQLLFFIPCMLSDLIEWLFHQWQMTPNIIFVLFILEILFILLYYYLPKIMSAIMENKAKTILLSGVSYLDHKNTVASTDTMMKLFKMPHPNPTYLLKAPTANYNNFSISMWIYLNPQPFVPTVNANTSSNAPFEYTIFNYNSVLDGSGGLPKITFLYDASNNNRETYNIYFTNAPNTEIPDDPERLRNPEYPYGKYQMYLTNQRWNHFVFNYDRNICDLYINGYLERSMNLVNTLPKINEYIDFSGNMTSLQMTTGQDGGLYGAICNVEYYTTPLTNLEIITKYNLLMNANPPTYNTGI